MFYIFLLTYKKWINPLKKLIIQKNIDVILNRAKDYHKNDKERLRTQARDKYRNLSEEEKNEKKKYWRNRYHKISEENKQKLKENQKNYLGVKMSQSYQ